MALREELLSLKPMLGTDAPEFYDKVKSIAARYTSEEDKKERSTAPLTMRMKSPSLE